MPELEIRYGTKVGNSGIKRKRFGGDGGGEGGAELPLQQDNIDQEHKLNTGSVQPGNCLGQQPELHIPNTGSVQLGNYLGQQPGLHIPNLPLDSSETSSTKPPPKKNGRKALSPAKKPLHEKKKKMKVASPTTKALPGPNKKQYPGTNLELRAEQGSPRIWNQGRPDQKTPGR